MYKIYYANVNDIAEESIFQQKMLEVRTARKQKVLRCKQKEDQLHREEQLNDPSGAD